MTVPRIDRIIFTQKGLTGKVEGFKDAYGLTKVTSEELNKDLKIVTFVFDIYRKRL